MKLRSNLLLFVKIMTCCLLPCVTFMGAERLSAQYVPSDSVFHTLQEQPWQEVFFDPGTSDWGNKWFLDGERGVVKNTPGGMVFCAGPVRGDNGSHSVLWTRKSFAGNIRIEFDYTRLDDINYAVNIIYILATGIGKPPYSEDISHWSTLRIIPYMNRYFRFMNLLHISYAAYPMEEDPEHDYVRARRYPVRPGMNFSRDTEIKPDYENTGLFVPGITYHFTIIKRDFDLYFRVKGPDKEKTFYWDTSGFDPVTHGRIGIRHMYTRAARYANIRVYELADKK